MLMKAGIIVLAGVLLGRLLGFLREIQLAAALGAGQIADAAIITLTLPDMLMNLFLSGALAYALIPELTGLSRENAWRLHVQTSLLAAAVFGALALATGIFSANVLQLFNQQLPSDLAMQAQRAISISAWLMPLIAMAGVTTAYLQANHRYAASAASTAIYNGMLVAGLSGMILFEASDSALMILSLAMIAGGLSRNIILWRNAAESRPAETVNAARGNLVRADLLKSYLFALAGGIALLLLPLLARMFSGQYGAGALAQFNYASKLVDLPLGVAITVISVVALPALSTAHAADTADPGDGGQWQGLLMQSLRLSILLSLVIMLPCIHFAPDLAHVAYDWGKMDAQALAGIESLLDVGFLLLLVQGTLSVTSAALASARNTAALAWSGVAGVLVFVLALSVQDRDLTMLMAAMVLAHVAVLAAQCVSLGMRHGIDWGSFLSDKRLYYPVAAVLAAFAILSVLFDMFETTHWQALVMFALCMPAMGGIVLLASAEIRQAIFSRFAK